MNKWKIGNRRSGQEGRALILLSTFGYPGDTGDDYMERENEKQQPKIMNMASLFSVLLWGWTQQARKFLCALHFAEILSNPAVH
jgi:hypothetical protein